MRRVILLGVNDQPLAHGPLYCREDVGALVARDTRVALGERVFAHVRTDADGSMVFREARVQYLTGDDHPDATHPPR